MPTHANFAISPRDAMMGAWTSAEIVVSRPAGHCQPACSIAYLFEQTIKESREIEANANEEPSSIADRPLIFCWRGIRSIDLSLPNIQCKVH
jgi:hypothetical protein